MCPALFACELTSSELQLVAEFHRRVVHFQTTGPKLTGAHGQLLQIPSLLLTL